MLLVDADVLIELARLGYLRPFLKQYDVHIPATVLDEAEFWEDEDGKHYIDWDDLGDKYTVVTATLEEARHVRGQKHVESGALAPDAGEFEAIAIYLNREDTEYQLCVCDAVVPKLLGSLLKTQGLMSLEKALASIDVDITRLRKQFTEGRLQKNIRQGRKMC
ncbi:MAG: hypothetical protein U5N86_01710 [Planctomycetota bacterium]|nr:hypothetical protein [Planctomycetota bacterium]